ncbi:histidine kinase [Microbacterium sp. STN6]|uniref:sensor histidine kinase n=1 Tax=Microbacterium sp. STN6 TaxID=2995588 RepID=UPI0022608D33|nr:ATP-binding protein [Microbacterium sp. STN6]MCX7522342.1 histidine kinase [Microbacterium sp. STN6]
MNGWLQENSGALMIGLVIAATALLVTTVLFLVLWLHARHARRRLADDRTETEWTRIDRELDLAEQQGRLRIIRELQDVAVQSLSRLITQAEGARYAGESDPEAGIRASAALVERGRVALGDMRRVLTVAREGEQISAPRPSLQSAQDLFQVMREAGLEISFEETGERFTLRRGAELAVFRILQGTLENALKHGGTGTRVRVGFTWTREGLQLGVDDDGIRSAARRRGLDREEINRETQYTIDDDFKALTESITGAGITEMRERAALFGGALDAHPVPGVGFTVSVAFPTLRFHNGVHGVDLSR